MHMSSSINYPKGRRSSLPVSFSDAGADAATTGSSWQSPLSTSGSDVRWWDGSKKWPTLRKGGASLAIILLTLASVDSILLKSAIRHTVFPSSKQVSSSSWDNLLYTMLTPRCPAGKIIAVPYNESIATTALVSYPRSGSSYTRSLIERASGYQTSSIYCDVRLTAFAAECDGLDSPFLVKTHYPMSQDIDPDIPHWHFYERAIRVVRNPLDAAVSNYHMNKVHNHVDRVKGFKAFGKEHRSKLARYAAWWNQHAKYWTEEAKTPIYVVRYEDLRQHTFATLMSLLSWLLPSDRLPSLEQVACAITDDPSKDAYRSRKSPIFTAWHYFEPETRDWFLDLVKEQWCAHDYHHLFEEVRGHAAPVDCRTTGPAS